MSDDEKQLDLSTEEVVTKYRTAGDIANAALKAVIDACEPGKKIVDLCNLGDKLITDACAKIYNKSKKKVEKGIAFPTCISTNEIVGHFSPLSDHERELKEGDVVKVDLGAHVDGFVAVGAHTFVLGADEVKGRTADVLSCAYNASELAIRMLRPGNKNSDMSDMFAKVAADFKCNPVQGVLSHNMNQFEIDGEKVIINREDVDNKVDECEFEPNEVYAIDVVMSTGEGKPKEVNERTTVFKRQLDTQYKLKMKASRAILSEINEKFPCFPFTTRALDEKKVRFGIVECYNHELVNSYPVLFEKQGEVVAHFKFTVLMLPSGPTKITGMTVDPAKYKTDLKVTDEALVKLLATAVKKKKKKNKKKKKKKKPAAEE